MYTQMAEQTQKLQDFNEIQQLLNTLLAALRAGEDIESSRPKELERLRELSNKYYEFDIYAPYTIARMETWQKNISSQQSSLGAVNEELTLTLNQKASERSAIFTQLQTLLQTMMQLRASLARW
jgi:hypothetical protein